MGPQKIPEVVLPCDLPTWSMVQEYLVVLQAGVTSEEMIVAMLRIYDICNVSPNASENEDAEITNLDDHMFDDFKQVIESGFSSRERERFLSRTLPCMARYALSLAQLRPTSCEDRKFIFSLKRDSPFTRSFDRRFVASLIANIFFSTYPRPRKIENGITPSTENPELHSRSVCLDVQRYMSFHTLFGKNLSSGLGNGTRLLKKFLNYFDTLDCEEPCGHVKIERYMTNDFDIEVLETISSNGLEFPESQPKALAPIFIVENSEQIDAQTDISSYILRDITNPLFIDNEPHPELLIILIYCENLLPNEFLRASCILPLPSSPSGNIITDNQGKAASTNHFFDISIKVQHNQLFEEVRNTLSCIKTIHEKEKEEVIISEEDRKSSTFSSKSSLLEKMVNNFSTKELSQDNLVRINNDEPIHNQVGGNLESIACFKEVEEKLNLKQRVNLALDQNCCGSNGSSNFSTVLTSVKSKFLERVGTVEHLGKESGDYAVEKEHEDPNTYLQKQRIHILETFCYKKAKRCISYDSWWLTNTFDDIDLLYNIKRKNSRTSQNIFQKSRSCEMFHSLFHTPLTIQSKNEDSVKSENKSSGEEFMPRPLWISGKPSDTFRFLVQWLVVSLLDIPLVILELQFSSYANKTKSDEANKNAIAKICIEADKKGWTTGDLMAIISREYFANTNESVEDCARRAIYFHA